MAEYLPLVKPGNSFTLKASAAITGGLLVAVSGVNTVATAGLASTAVVGVAGFDAAINDNVTVWAGGIQEVTAGGAITAGDQVTAGAAGTVVTVGAGTAFQVVGVALNTAANAAKVRVQFGR